MSKDPNDRALGPKYYDINGILALKPYYLGPCTLRVRNLDLGSYTGFRLKNFRASFF